MVKRKHSVEQIIGQLRAGNAASYSGNHLGSVREIRWPLALRPITQIKSNPRFLIR